MTIGDGIWAKIARECLFQIQNLTFPKSGVILRSGVLGIFIIRGLTAKSKKHLYGAAYANSRARDENLNKIK
jgi:hypothetical protein